MISKTEKEEEWFMLDPDFRWEGNMEREKVLHSVRDNPFGGGYFIDIEKIQEPTEEMVASYFTETFKKNDNELTMELKNLIVKMANEEEGYALSGLVAAVKQIPVLAIRKYSYEHAFAYFRETLQYSEQEFDYWCDRVEDIVQGFTNVQYRAIKMAMMNNKGMLLAIVEKLDEMNAIELQIKAELERQFLLWKEMKINESVLAFKKSN
jgi:petrobactin synthase